MRTIFAEYNPQRNSIDIYTNVGYMLRIDFTYGLSHYSISILLSCLIWSLLL